MARESVFCACCEGVKAETMQDTFARLDLQRQREELAQLREQLLAQVDEMFHCLSLRPNFVNYTVKILAVVILLLNGCWSPTYPMAEMFTLVDKNVLTYLGLNLPCSFTISTVFLRLLLHCLSQLF